MTSSENTEPESESEGEGAANLPVPAPAHNPSLTRVHPSTNDLQVADLQSTLEREREERVVERWAWLAGSGLLFVMFCFSAVGVAAGTVCLVVYLTVVTVLGNRWGIEGILETLAKVHKLFGSSKTEE